MRFKRGDTFVLAATRRDDSGAPKDITGYDVRAQVRNGGVLVCNLEFAAVDLAAGHFTMTATATQTATWPLGDLVCDIRYQSPEGVVESTEMFYIQVRQGVTAVTGTP